jgi:hypothetical protein
MNKYYVYRKSTESLHGEKYWKGTLTPSMNPSETVSIDLARYFDTPGEAYKVAGKYEKLKNWRVGRRPIPKYVGLH